jgi:hypothetical protein
VIIGSAHKTFTIIFTFDSRLEVFLHLFTRTGNSQGGPQFLNEVTALLSVQKYTELKYSMSCTLNFPELDNNRPIAQETAVCHKPLIRSFREEKKNLTDYQQTNS